MREFFLELLDLFSLSQIVKSWSLFLSKAWIMESPSTAAPQGLKASSISAQPRGGHNRPSLIAMSGRTRPSCTSASPRSSAPIRPTSYMPISRPPVSTSSRTASRPPAACRPRLPSRRTIVEAERAKDESFKVATKCLARRFRVKDHREAITILYIYPPADILPQ
ncbi:hypothetical protein EDB87DRAFT_1419966 [Lactarius vividus]|nr:hypothetical protein EDB87DRAFT_1419966 [Lactarius vividus]